MTEHPLMGIAEMRDHIMHFLDFNSNVALLRTLCSLGHSDLGPELEKWLKPMCLNCHLTLRGREKNELSSFPICWHCFRESARLICLSRAMREIPGATYTVLTSVPCRRVGGTLYYPYWAVVNAARKRRLRREDAARRRRARQKKDLRHEIKGI